MHGKMDKARNLFALFIWLFSLSIAPQAAGDLSTLQKMNVAQYLTPADSFRCSSSQSAVIQKGKELKQSLVEPLFIIEYSHRTNEQKFGPLVELHFAFSSFSLTSHLLYTETTTSRL